ncbi:MULTISPECIES: anti-sigma factor [unclassified Streptomyces]|uniref:anti-sigma factor n=1 Tax=unclassified Streptomyces TaxID=2593676 RepID=UPI002E2CC5C0|nr:anti-sigma factor [Streptomyces sp. NBC_00441]
MTDAGLHTLTGAYALHALPDIERRDFERHLGACDACSTEVRELSETATRLGLAVAAPAPRELRERVLREITTVRQEPPALPRRGRSPDRRGGAAGWSRFALAACLAGAVGFGGIAVWQHQEARDAQRQADATRLRAEQVARVLTAPDAKTTSGALDDGAQGTVVVSRHEDRAVFLASGLGEAPSGKVYQLWFSDGGTMRPAGLLHASGSSSTTYTTLLDGPVDGATGMGITVEPAGGSTRPTSDPVALMELPA